MTQQSLMEALAQTQLQLSTSRDAGFYPEADLLQALDLVVDAEQQKVELLKEMLGAIPRRSPQLTAREARALVAWAMQLESRNQIHRKTADAVLEFAQYLDSRGKRLDFAVLVGRCECIPPPPMKQRSSA